MSYTTIHQCANDSAFTDRLIACAAQEGSDNPEFDMSVRLRWPAASYPEIEDVYAYAIDTGNENPGGDPGVISDAMILAVVQPILNPPPPDVPNPL